MCNGNHYNYRSLEYTIHDHELRDTRKKLDEVMMFCLYCIHAYYNNIACHLYGK
jgi:hypothetical protein